MIDLSHILVASGTAIATFFAPKGLKLILEGGKGKAGNGNGAAGTKSVDFWQREMEHMGDSIAERVSASIQTGLSGQNSLLERQNRLLEKMSDGIGEMNRSLAVLVDRGQVRTRVIIDNKGDTSDS